MTFKEKYEAGFYRGLGPMPKRKDDERIDKKELEEKAGERLKFVGIVSLKDVDLRCRAGDLEEVAPGLFRETDRAYQARTGRKRSC